MFSWFCSERYEGTIRAKPAYVPANQTQATSSLPNQIQLTNVPPKQIQDIKASANRTQATNSPPNQTQATEVPPKLTEATTTMNETLNYTPPNHTQATEVVTSQAHASSLPPILTYIPLFQMETQTTNSQPNQTQPRGPSPIAIVHIVEDIGEGRRTHCCVCCSSKCNACDCGGCACCKDSCDYCDCFVWVGGLCIYVFVGFVVSFVVQSLSQ